MLEHPKLPFVSYSYEWSFSMLKAAALLHLDVLAESLASGFTLTDGSSYNVQFIDTRPVFIDFGSFRRYVDGAPWSGYAQFCRHFLFPLLLTAYRGVHHQRLLRSSLDGVSLQMARTFLPLRAKVHPGVFAHVVLQAALESHDISDKRVTRDAYRLPRPALLGLVAKLHRLIESLRMPHTRSPWSDYERSRSYTQEAHERKLRTVLAVVRERRPRSIWDIGCNVGTYTLPVSAHAPLVVGMDADAVVVDLLYGSALANEARLLPLVMDIADPSPSQGWAQLERQGLADRGPADMILCLGLVHHLRIAAGIPLSQLVEWLAASGNLVVLEFVPRSDPMVQRMLQWRDPAVFRDYDQAVLEELLSHRFDVASRDGLPGSDRVLFTLLRRH